MDLNMNSCVRLRQEGFTLIELLVVVAIIGILSTIVLVSMAGAKNSGINSKVKSDLHGVRAQAQLYVIDNPDYGTLATTSMSSSSSNCLSQSAGSNVFGDPKVKEAITSARAAAGGNIRCASGKDFWVVAVQLSGNTSKMWCVSSSGVAKLINHTTGTGLSASLSANNTCWPK